MSRWTSRGRARTALRFALLAGLAFLLLSCARSARIGDTRAGVSASPRVIADGEPVPRGGGGYKLGEPYKIGERWYVPRHDTSYDRSGTASWYGADFHGRKTANGEVFDSASLTAAHPTLPLPSYAYVTNLDNDRTLLVRINDRGPFVGHRIIDLSLGAARHLGFEGEGLARVRVRYAGRAPLDGDDRHERRFLAGQPWNRSASLRIAPPPEPAALPSGLTWRR